MNNGPPFCVVNFDCRFSFAKKQGNDGLQKEEVPRMLSTSFIGYSSCTGVILPHVPTVEPNMLTTEIRVWHPQDLEGKSRQEMTQKLFSQSVFSLLEIILLHDALEQRSSSQNVKMFISTLSQTSLL